MSEEDELPPEVARSLSHRSRSTSPEGERPPLPPRPATLSFFRGTSANPAQRPTSRGTLLSTATTAVSLTGVNTNARHDGTRELRTSGINRTASAASVRSRRSVAHFGSGKTSDAGDTSSVLSYMPNDMAQDVESLFDDRIGLYEEVVENKDLYKIFDTDHHFEDVKINFVEEFSGVGQVERDRSNEEKLLQRWKEKKKHFIILSAAGKPIYTRHGDENLTSGYVGIIQTIISFYKGAEDPLSSFTAGGVKFVVLSRGPLFLVAITKFFENDAQLRAQLDALYMQILSTLTLPTLEHLFSVRPSTDLRRPLQGTEVLLSSLADTFTKGSPSTLLSALECLKLRKSQRQTINNTLLKLRSATLLYGLVVAGGRLVSVIRPKKHSLHPSDLQLIFNMIFEAEGIKAGGGESWIPICLPGFNNKGYLHMYVSFLSLSGEEGAELLEEDENIPKEEAVAIIFISADKESFYDMRKMRDDLVSELDRNGSVKILRTAVQHGRPAAVDIIPGTFIRHFLYKSKANVQFMMPSFYPQYATPEARRSLLSTYHILHDSVHAKHSHVKVHHSIGSCAALAWETPIFEFYAVAGANAPRNALAQSATKVIQWVQREEARIFILGGAVF